MIARNSPRQHNTLLLLLLLLLLQYYYCPKTPAIPYTHTHTAPGHSADGPGGSLFRFLSSSSMSWELCAALGALGVVPRLSLLSLFSLSLSSPKSFPVQSSPAGSRALSYLWTPPFRLHRLPLSLFFSHSQNIWAFLFATHIVQVSPSYYYYQDKKEYVTLVAPVLALRKRAVFQPVIFNFFIYFRFLIL